MTIPQENRAYMVLADLDMHFPEVPATPWVPTSKRYLVKAETMHDAVSAVQRMIEADPELKFRRVSGIPDQIDLSSTIIDVT